ncbi:hypothetical protein COOONC_07286 [Cooperia oncophora]
MEEQQYQWQIRQRYYHYRYNIDQELRRRGHFVGEEIDAPPTQLAPAPPVDDYNEYGTGDSMVVSSDVFYTMREASTLTAPPNLAEEDGPASEESEIRDPTYVNLNFLKAQHMQQSTRL